MTLLKSNTVILAALLLATVALYANSLNNPFVPDDRGIIFKNFRSWEGWTPSDLLGRSLFSRDPSESTYFRPLTLLTFGLNYTLAKGSPSGYRIVNIALHLLVVSLTFLLLSRLTTRWVAAFSALLFALHPAHVQAVSYISSRSDPLYTSLALLSLLFWHRGSPARGGRKQLYFGLSLGFFFLGLFAKETMIVVPALVLLMDLNSNSSDLWHEKIKGNLVWYLGFLLLFSLYLSIRFAHGFPLTMESSGKIVAGAEFGLGTRALLALKLFGLYTCLAFYPVRLNLFRSVPLPQSYLEWEVVSGFTILMVSVLLIRVFWRSRRGISFGISWFLVSIVPILNLVLLNADMMEHWLYLPLIGLAVSFVGGMRMLAERIGETRGAAIALILFALLLSSGTYARNTEWNDLVKVFSRNVSAYPGHPTAWVWLGDALKAKGKWNDAIEAYKTALKLKPNYQALLGLVDSLSAVGGEKQIEETLSRAVTTFPEEPWLFHILAMQRLKAGDNQAAVEAIQKNIALGKSPSSYHILGSAYLRSGEADKAEQAFRDALFLEPGNPSSHAAVHMALAKLYQLQGKIEEARIEWTLALRFSPGHPDAGALLDKYRK